MAMVYLSNRKTIKKGKGGKNTRKVQVVKADEKVREAYENESK